jgi:antirestriction protein ArdC
VDRVAREAARNAVLDAIPAVIELGGGSAFYQRDRDIIRLPLPEAFRSVDDFLATKAHEQLHWSGAEHRLNRTFGRRFGDQAYAFEELVAEIGAAALGLRIGLRPQLLDDHAAYLAHWAKILKDRPSALLEASGHAQRAVDHLIAYSQAGSQAVAQAA